LADALVELAAWSANAEFSLVRVQRQMIQCKLPASDVRRWPHHFDLAMLASVPGAGCSPPQAMSVLGFRPETRIMTSPISMCRCIPSRTELALPRLPKLGHCIRTSSRRLLCRRIRLSRPIIQKLRPMNSQGRDRRRDQILEEEGTSLFGRQEQQIGANYNRPPNSGTLENTNAAGLTPNVRTGSTISFLK
jgi:hypothetical protein